MSILKRLFKSYKFQIFITSSLILYLELALIRFIPAYVRYLGYFTNIILLGVFLGIGLGCLLAKKRLNFFILFAPLLLLLILLVTYFKFEIGISTLQVIYFKSNTEDQIVESFVMLPSIFLVITLIFITLAQKLGQLLSRISPLIAYKFDIIGSIFGILLFSLSSILKLPPIIWFATCGGLFLLLLLNRKIAAIFSVIILLISFWFVLKLDRPGSIWSPYYQIYSYSVSNPLREAGKIDNHWRLYVNNISHQEMTQYEQAAQFYKLVYETFPQAQFKQALIVGAGSGQDVNVAIKNNVQKITAVEIDPVIANMGRKLHPDNPYADKKVQVVINDARSFLENTDKKYDLVIFALPDSAVLATSMSNLRLESYLFTAEAFSQVKKHLSENGTFVLYNYYRTPWLIDKIALMLQTSFGQKPFISRYEDNLAVFITGPKTVNLKNSAKLSLWQQTEKLPVATDNWPFLYLQDIFIPNIYLKTLIIISSIALGLYVLIERKKSFVGFSGDFFFLGAAFLLIETKSVVNFNLLFGSTWFVNSLVFVGMLLSVLIAIWINQKYTIKNLAWPSFLLLVILGLNYLIPLEKFLLPNFWIRYIVSIVFFFSPILLANIIFSNLFKKSKNAAENFGANTLGAFFGGMFEYMALLLGYHNLILIAVIFYCLAFMFALKRLKASYA